MLSPSDGFLLFDFFSHKIVVCSVDRTSPQRIVYWSQLRFSKSEFTQFYDPDHLFASGSYSLSLGSTKCLPRLSESLFYQAV